MFAAKVRNSPPLRGRWIRIDQAGSATRSGLVDGSGFGSFGTRGAGDGSADRGRRAAASR
jgi:hypothetical protein